MIAFRIFTKIFTKFQQVDIFEWQTTQIRGEIEQIYVYKYSTINTDFKGHISSKVSQ